MLGEWSGQESTKSMSVAPNLSVFGLKEMGWYFWAS